MARAKKDEFEDSLEGQLLIAMPGLSAAPFNHSVIYLCQHDRDHAMGLILNQPIKGLSFGRMIKELGITNENPNLDSQHIYRGGPVQNDRGFVLHSLDYRLDDATLSLTGPSIQLPSGQELGLGLTASRDILVDLSAGAGPSHAMIALGYAGWGPGQLEDEIAANAWLLAPATQALLFGSETEHMWMLALASIGVDPAHLSGFTGTA